MHIILWNKNTPTCRKPAYSGFTIVELLIVVVVIGILSAVTLTAYNGIQARARDSQRQQAIKTIAKALELYYIDNGQYPPSSCSASCKINASWNTTADTSWANLQAALVPTYISALPTDPKASTTTNAAIGGGYNFDYYANSAGWCSKPINQLYLLAFNLESSPKTSDTPSDCTGTQPTNYPNASEYIRTH